MAKHLTDILKGVKSSTVVPAELPPSTPPQSAGDKAFVAKHKIEKHADRHAEPGQRKSDKKPALDDPKNARMRPNKDNK